MTGDDLATSDRQPETSHERPARTRSFPIGIGTPTPTQAETRPQTAQERPALGRRAAQAVPVERAVFDRAAVGIGKAPITHQWMQTFYEN